MSARPHLSRSARPTLLALVGALALAVTQQPASGAVSATPCGPATAATVLAVDASVANNIYRDELTGGEVVADVGHITASPLLAQAVADGDRAAAFIAVHALVHHRRWHIVRLRVLDTTGHVLAEDGGPYVIAPVRGSLTLDGRVVGSFVMSVQDDVGFTKLEMHAAGRPIGIYYQGKLVAHLGASFPRAAPSAPTLSRGGVSYSTLTQTYNAFPSGSLKAVVLVPPPPAALATRPCIAVRAVEIGRVAKLLTLRFHPLAASYPDFAETVHADTGATVILRIGQRAIPGSQGLGPAVIPDGGLVSYLNRDWWVVSFAPTPPARIYLMIRVPVTALSSP